MNKLGVTTTALALLGSTSFALAQNSLETTLDLMVRGMIDDGSQVTYDDRITGNDGSVEYRNVTIVSPNGSSTLTTAWLKGVPSAADPSVVTFTVADTIKIESTKEGGEFTMEFLTSGMEFTTNAVLREAMSNDDITVEFKADSFRVEGGDPASAFMRDLNADFGSINFSMVAAEADKRVEGSLDISKFDVTYDITVDGQSQKAEQTSEGASAEFAFDVPKDENDAMGYLDGSKSARIKMASGASTFDVSVDSPEAAFGMAGTSGASTALVEMIDGTFTYDVQGDSLQMTITPGAGMPFPPVDLGIGEIGMKFVVPVNSADAPDEATVRLLLADLTVGEGLWSMIDPGKTIPRDPAQIDIDLEAMVQIDAMVAAAGGDPTQAGKIFSLDVNQFLLAIGGASAQMDGALTFNNDGPIPMPLGGVNVDLNGINGLANKLVALGLVDQMQVGMVLGIMMAFGKPGDNPDQFISEITFTENGILANGQPIQ